MVTKKIFAGGLVALAVAVVAGVGAQEIVFQPTLQNGDWNGDGQRDVTDVIGMASWLFLGGPGAEPVQCSYQDSYYSDPLGRNGDLNADARINVTDVAYLINFLYLGGPAPIPVGCDQPF